MIEFSLNRRVCKMWSPTTRDDLDNNIVYRLRTQLDTPVTTTTRIEHVWRISCTRRLLGIRLGKV